MGHKLLLIMKASVKHQQKNGKLSEIKYNFEEQKYSYQMTTNLTSQWNEFIIMGNVLNLFY